MTIFTKACSLRRHVSWGVLAACAAWMPCHVGAQSSPLMAAGELKVGVEVAYPPFESWLGDRVVGFDPELSALLAREMKARPIFMDTKMAGLILGLGAGQFDTVISALYITPERTAIADAIPYAGTGALILVAKGGPVQPKTEKELCGLKVGLQQGTAWISAIQKLSEAYCVGHGKPPVHVSEFPTGPEVTQALLSRNVEAQIEIAGTARMFAERTRNRLTISSPDLIYPQTLGIYIRKGNTPLRQAIEQALGRLRASGEYAALIKKYELEAVPAAQ